MGNINNYTVDNALVGTEKLLMSNTPAGGATNNTTVDAVALAKLAAAASAAAEGQ